MREKRLITKPRRYDSEEDMAIPSKRSKRSLEKALLDEYGIKPSFVIVHDVNDNSDYFDIVDETDKCIICKIMLKKLSEAEKELYKGFQIEMSSRPDDDSLSDREDEPLSKFFKENSSPREKKPNTARDSSSESPQKGEKKRNLGRSLNHVKSPIKRLFPTDKESYSSETEINKRTPVIRVRDFAKLGTKKVENNLVLLQQPIFILNRTPVKQLVNVETGELSSVAYDFASSKVPNASAPNPKGAIGVKVSPLVTGANKSSMMIGMQRKRSHILVMESKSLDTVEEGLTDLVVKEVIPVVHSISSELPLAENSCHRTVNKHCVVDLTREEHDEDIGNREIGEIHVESSKFPVWDANVKFKCVTCAKEFDTYDEYVVHRPKHSNENLCEQCGKDFRTSDDLLLHACKKTAKGVSSPATLLTCSCGKKFTYPSSFRAHVETCSKSDPIKCECDSVFPTKSALLRHQMTCQLALKFKCVECLKWFKNQKDLDVHATTHAQKNVYGCDGCPKFFLTAAYLEKHKATLCPSRNKPKAEPVSQDLTCRKCGADFISDEDLMQHPCIPVEEVKELPKSSVKYRPYSTREIPFTKERIITPKVKPKNDGSEVARFKCSMCSAKFKAMEDLKFHEGNHTPPRK